jgi:hypothetical protein
MIYLILQSPKTLDKKTLLFLEYIKNRPYKDFSSFYIAHSPEVLSFFKSHIGLIHIFVPILSEYTEYFNFLKSMSTLKIFHLNNLNIKKA